jgi:serine/threonine-protein kinase
LVLSKGAIIGDRFEVIGPLGEGGMGQVVSVIDRELGSTPLALKVLYQHLVNDAQVLERFRNEVRNARCLSHRQIVRTYELGHTNKNRYYISMELIDGSDVREILNRRNGSGIELEQAVDILRQVTSGIAHAHRKGVIHRDIKPRNILVSTNGDIKISDFGLSRQLDASHHLTKTGEAVGTPLYMSPEQFRGEEPDIRSDIYSIGIVAYELITGKVPFHDETYYHLAVKHLSEPLPNFEELAELKIPTWYRHIVRTCTEKNKNNRFSSADELLEAIEHGGKISMASSTYSPKAIEVEKGSDDPYIRQIEELAQKRFKQKRNRYLSGTFLVFLLSIYSSLALQDLIAIGTLMLHKSFVAMRMRPIARIVHAPIRFIWNIDRDATNPMDLLNVLKDKKGDVDSLRREASLLVRAGIPLDAVDHQGNTALHLAASRGWSDLVKLILARADLADRRNKRGETAIHRSIRQHDLASVRALANSTNNINQADFDGNTPVHLAVDLRNIAILRELIRNDAALNIRNHNGETPLHTSMKDHNPNQLEIVNELVAGGADIDFPDSRGKRSSEIAFSSSNLELFRLALTHSKTKSIRPIKTPTADKPSLSSNGSQTNIFRPVDHPVQ